MGGLWAANVGFAAHTYWRHENFAAHTVWAARKEIASGMVFFAAHTYLLSSLASCFATPHYMLE